MNFRVFLENKVISNSGWLFKDGTFYNVNFLMGHEGKAKELLKTLHNYSIIPESAYETCNLMYNLHYYKIYKDVNDLLIFNYYYHHLTRNAKNVIEEKFYNDKTISRVLFYINDNNFNIIYEKQ